MTTDAASPRRLREVPCPKPEPHDPHDSDQTPGNPGSPLAPAVRCPGVIGCPHGADKSHGGLGKAWCQAGIEGQRRAARRRLRTLSEDLAELEASDPAVAAAAAGLDEAIERLNERAQIHGLQAKVRWLDEGVWERMSKTVAVDWDGTLHPYTKGWTGSEPDDEPPIPGAEDFLVGLVEAGYTVVIFSARADHLDGAQGIIRYLHKWMPRAFGALRGQGDIHVTHIKVPAIAYVDDRGVTFRGDYAAARAAIDELAAGRAHGAAAPAPGAEHPPPLPPRSAIANRGLDAVGES